MLEQPSLSQKLLAQISADEHLIIRFFAVFSRFEYSLKRAGYVLDVNSGVSANWDKFASELNSSFDVNQYPQLKNAVEYIVHNPPKKQIRSSDGKLSWLDMPWDEKEPLLIWLLTAIRRIRNNLFHGGKFPKQPVQDPTRDQKLLEFGLCILETCLSLEVETAKKVHRYFVDKLD